MAANQQYKNKKNQMKKNKKQKQQKKQQNFNFWDMIIFNKNKKIQDWVDEQESWNIYL